MRTVSAQSWQVVMVLLDLGFGIVSWIVFLLACTIHAVATIFIVRYPQILEQKTGTHRNWRPDKTQQTTALVHEKWCKTVEASSLNAVPKQQTSKSPTLKPLTVLVSDEIIVVSQQEAVEAAVAVARAPGKHRATRNPAEAAAAPRAKAERKTNNKSSAQQTMAQKTAMLPPPPGMPPQGVARTNHRHTKKKQTKSSESADDLLVVI